MTRLLTSIAKAGEYWRRIRRAWTGRANNRLPAETVDLGDVEGYRISLSLARDAETGILRELVYVERPKEGSKLELFLHTLSVRTSRAIQGRNPKDTHKKRGIQL